MSVFTEDWRECMREQYKSVVRNNDQVTLPSLTAVLNRLGFTESELERLRIEATMRAEDMPDDFVPAEVTQPAPPQPEKVFEPHPMECQCPECINENLAPHDDDGQLLTGDDLKEYEERQQYKEDEDNPQQLSMF